MRFLDAFARVIFRKGPSRGVGSHVENYIKLRHHKKSLPAATRETPRWQGRRS